MRRKRTSSAPVVRGAAGTLDWLSRHSHGMETERTAAVHGDWPQVHDQFVWLAEHGLIERDTDPRGKPWGWRCTTKGLDTLITRAYLTGNV